MPVVAKQPPDKDVLCRIAPFSSKWNSDPPKGSALKAAEIGGGGGAKGVRHG